MTMLMVRVSPAFAQGRVGGGTVASLLVNADDGKKAESAARVFLAQQQWQVEQVLEATAVKSADGFQSNQELRRLYNRALKNGIACFIPGRPAIEI